MSGATDPQPIPSDGRGRTATVGSTTASSESTGAMRAGDVNKLVLNPAMSKVQNIAVYGTKTRFYLIGSNNTETVFRVLKIDRTEPRELVIIDDKIKYTMRQIRNLLTMIDSGNKQQPGRAYSKSGGLQKTASGFGLLGFVRFLEGYYLILITKKTCAALIGGHAIHKVEDTQLIYIPHEGRGRHDPNEAKYAQVFQNVDLSSSFYFSYSYDITHPLQHNMRTRGFWERVQRSKSPAIPWRPCSKFVWNEYLLESAHCTMSDEWVLVATQGFISQANISVYGRPIYISLIARRSKEYAGCRFLKRGTNDVGHVANEVETEQIVHDAAHLSHNTGRFTSFVQVRGSVPLFWSQDPSGMTPKPPIGIDRNDPYFSSAAMHFNSLFERYGTPVFVLNLVKKRERRPRESILSDNMQLALNYLNQFIPPELHIQYVHFDMARYSRSKDSNVLDKLDQIAEKAFAETGFFHAGPELLCNQHYRGECYKRIGGVGYRPGQPFRLQTGVVRVNCVDCLDRTNTAQFVVGKRALGFQLFALGVVDDPILELDTDCMRMFEGLYEGHGDIIALQYGGSQLVHRIRTYRKLSQWTIHSREIMNTISRYYSNTFNDHDKQCAINVFLGKYQPARNRTPIWDMPTDYYLHHLEAAGFTPLRESYTAWLSQHLYTSIPLPYQEQVELASDDSDVCSSPDPTSPLSTSPPSTSPPSTSLPPAYDSASRHSSLSHSTSRHSTAIFGGKTGMRSGTYLKHTFLDHYQPWELSGFEDYEFCHSMLTTLQFVLADKANPSPFVVRKKVKKHMTPQAGVGPRRIVAGSPAVHTNQSGSSTDDDADTSDEEHAVDGASTGHGDDAEKVPTLPGERREFDLAFPNSGDFQHYMRHADQFTSASGPKEPMSSPLSMLNDSLWCTSPIRPFTSTSYEANQPIVSMSSYDTYAAAVDVAHHGARYPSHEEYEVYKAFCKAA
eukprot:scpid21982/ scgid0701/ Polyphosphoinositide phosphatase; Phosphatidylinositol 3,5-bisphosphate 5-phosphatase; SAC domain-containing protein 3